jgi:hypothetical protein
LNAKEHSYDALVLEAHNQSGGARDLSLIPPTYGVLPELVYSLFEAFPDSGHPDSNHSFDSSHRAASNGGVT